MKKIPANSIRSGIFATSPLTAILAGVLLLFLAIPLSAQQQDDDSPQRTGRLIKVDLPLTGTGVTRVIQQIRELASQMPVAVAAKDRSVLVLEFDATDETSGQGSNLGSSHTLAEFLTGPEMKSIRTVAWIPGGRKKTALIGHAVLAAVSCNEIVMAENASIGNAGVDMENVPQYVKQLYQGIAEKRLTLPVPLVLGMLESGDQIERVKTDAQTIFATSEQRKKLQATGEVREFDPVSGPGEATMLSSQQMIDFRLIRNQTSSRADLARRFNVTVSQLASADQSDRIWNAVEYKLPTTLSEREVSWLIRAINRERAGGADMVILEFGDVRGDENASLRLAEYLAGLDSDTRTVAWISGHCEGLVGVAALATDEVNFSGKGKLGDAEDRLPTPTELASYEITVRAVARQKDRDWSTLMGLVNPKMVVKKYRNINTGANRVMGKAEFEELPEQEAVQWLAAERLDFSDGMDATIAKEIGVGNDQIAQSMDVVKSRYEFESKPKSLEPTETERWIEELASFLTSPAISMMLVFGAFTCFMNELSAPGLGGFGFLAVLLLTAFFWSHHLEGNADWFEILLFVVGIVFIGVELFIVPGFGLFGVSGILMVIVSLVLAGQDFVVPENEKQVETLAWSLLPILGAFFGVVVGGVLLHKVFPNSPLFKRLALAPPERLELNIDGTDREAVVDWSHLNGQKGKAVTPIMPSGKARINGKVYDVISDGQVIDKGQSIEVVEAIANRVVVRQVN